MTKGDQQYDWICAILVVFFLLPNSDQLPVSHPSSLDIATVCRANVQSKYEGRCCKNCPPGQHMIGPCTDENPNSTQCAPCGPNTFTAYKNLRRTCFPHNKCRHGQQTDKAGNATADYECSCKRGFVKTADNGCRFSAPNYQLEERPVTEKRHKLQASQKPTQEMLFAITPSIFKLITTMDYKEHGKTMGTIGGDDYGYGGTTKERKSEVLGGLGTNEVVVIVTVTVSLCVFGGITVTAIIICRRQNGNGAKKYKIPADSDTISNDRDSISSREVDNRSSTTTLTDTRGPGSGASTSSSDINLINFGEPSEESSPALGINDTMEPSSEASNLLGEDHFPGIPETGKAKSCTSLNDLRQNLPNDD
ncbi:uncharacterized protein [Ptychodera flava]|uniref:uncharacterized protein n=1 Tax=Ptychodera flava TaxID=63121 RepID=UPI003969FE7F